MSVEHQRTDSSWVYLTITGFLQSLVIKHCHTHALCEPLTGHVVLLPKTISQMVCSHIQDAPMIQNKYTKEFKLKDKKGRKKDIKGEGHSDSCWKGHSLKGKELCRRNNDSWCRWCRQETYEEINHSSEMRMLSPRYEPCFAQVPHFLGQIPVFVTDNWKFGGKHVSWLVGLLR